MQALAVLEAALGRDHDDALSSRVSLGLALADAGRLTEEGVQWLAWEQPVTTGVNGRVARTGERSLVDDTRLDADYVGSGPSLDPGS